MPVSTNHLSVNNTSGQDKSLKYKKINRRGFDGRKSTGPFGVSSLFHSKEGLIKEEGEDEDQESNSSEKMDTVMITLNEKKQKLNRKHMSGNPYARGNNRESRSSCVSSNFQSSEGGVYFEAGCDSLPETKLVVNNEDQFIELKDEEPNKKIE